MAEERQKTILITDTTREEFLAHALKQLSESLGANGVWIGLPDDVLALAQVSAATSLQTIRDWLPTSAQSQLCQSNNCLAGQGIAAQAAQIGAEIFPEIQPGPFWIAAPVPLENWPSGCLLVTRSRPVDLSELDESFDHTITLIASAIEHNLYRQAVSQYRCSLETLHTISLRMASPLEIQEVLDLLVQSTLEILPADTAFVYIHSNDPDALQPYFLSANAWRDPAQKPGHTLPIPRKLLELATKRSWPMIVDNIQEHSLYSEMQSYGCYSGALMAYPIKRSGRMMGVFLVHIFQPHATTPEERYMLSLITDLALAALENVQTAQTMSGQLAELASLQSMAQKITITLEPQEVLQIIVQTLQNMLNASVASIMLIDESQTLRRTATAGDETTLPDPIALAPGEGYAGRVALSARPISIPNVQAEEQASLKSARFQSLYISPLKLQNRIIGVLSVTSAQPNAFGEEAVRIIAIASAQAAIALENSRLYHTERRRADELKTIIDLSHLITQHLDPDLIFDAAYQAISHLMKAEAFVISILDRRTSEVVLTYVIDKSVRYPAVSRSNGNGLSEYVIRTGNTVLIDDLENQEIPFERIRFGSSEPVRSILAVPLLAGGKAIGMVAAESYRVSAYSQHNLQLLQSIANAIATAIENSQLYAQLEERYQKLQQSEMKRLAFIQDISHELRNPLTFLKGYIDLLLAGDMGTLNERQNQALAVVAEKTNTLARLVSEIATLQTNPAHLLQMQQIDLVRIIRNAVLLAQETAHEHDITLILDAPELLPAMQADPDRIVQVVDNLLSNAIKFGYPGSQVLLRLQEQNGQALVSISNRGEPIPEADRSKIFERFFQTSRRKDGLGLGLAIVKHIVEAHHGKVWFESEAEKGTTFFILLPYQQPDESAL